MLLLVATTHPGVAGARRAFDVASHALLAALKTHARELHTTNNGQDACTVSVTMSMSMSMSLSFGALPSAAVPLALHVLRAFAVVSDHTFIAYPIAPVAIGTLRELATFAAAAGSTDASASASCVFRDALGSLAALGASGPPAVATLALDALFTVVHTCGAHTDDACASSEVTWHAVCDAMPPVLALCGWSDTSDDAVAGRVLASLCDVVTTCPGKTYMCVTHVCHT